MLKKRKSRNSSQRKTPHMPTKGQETPAKCVGHLLELHKLQGVLLNRLNKVVR